MARSTLELVKIDPLGLYTVATLSLAIGDNDKDQRRVKRWIELGLKFWEDGNVKWILGETVLEFIRSKLGRKREKWQSEENDESGDPS